MQAKVGDRIMIRTTRVGEKVRNGEITEVRGPSGAPPYVVRWAATGHDGLYFPDSDAVIQHGEQKAVGS